MPRNRLINIKHNTTTEIINELTSRFDDVIFIGRDRDSKHINAISYGDSYANIGMMESFSMKIHDEM